ncbi:glycoside hydrolase family 16 protein [Pseudonocardia aurantiaca]|uniref:Glycoside hydrolase family 16 protein n=1 Tax=Pseudonocardia aurantiaca TaxID=75290 RepID=A0ABW4FAZ4_9PSEU
MRRMTSAAGERSESPTELIARITAEHDSSTVTGTGRHRLPARDVEAVVTRDPLPKRSMTRRLAPLAVGATVMLIATTVATLARPAEEDSLAAQELSNAIVRTEPTTVEVPTPQPTPEALPTTVPPPPATTEASAPPRPSPTTRAPAPRAAPPPPPTNDGRQAATVKGWTLVASDEFNGSKSPKWTDYNGAGHAGNGRRTSDAISIENGSLVIRGDSKGNTGGMAWADDQRFGKWEMRARFPKGDDQYHPVLILWPETGGSGNGETDFAETTSASDKVSFFLHYGSEQEYAHKTIDITQWHNYAVEWVDGRMTGYIDGEKWFESTDAKTLPGGKLHPTIQLDYFPDGGSPQPTEMYVDYMRIYR